MLSRKENGKLSLEYPELQKFLSDLFEKCKTEIEVTWLSEQISDYTEAVADDRVEDLEIDEDLKNEEESCD